MAWKDHIESLKKEFIGKQVYYCNEKFTIVNVDYNGLIHINKPSKFNQTTAVYSETEARRNLA